MVIVLDSSTKSLLVLQGQGTHRDVRNLGLVLHSYLIDLFINLLTNTSPYTTKYRSIFHSTYTVAQNRWYS